MRRIIISSFTTELKAAVWLTESVDVSAESGLDSIAPSWSNVYWPVSKSYFRV